MTTHNNINEVSAETLETFKKALDAQMGQPADPRLGKATTTQGYSQNTGLVSYDLQAPAKNLFPVITPLINKFPRVKGHGDIATRWKMVTAINSTNLRGGVPEGQRAGFGSVTTDSKLQAYATIGYEDFVNFEAVNAAMGFEDIRATSAQRALWAAKIIEEKMVLGGNSSAGIALGTTPTPVATNAGAGGNIAAATYSVICVALAHGAWVNSSMSGGVPDLVTVTLPDGSTYSYNAGSALKSASGSTTTSGATSTITASVTAVQGAVAYAWYVGVAGSERLQAITTINSVILTSLSGTNELIAAKFTVDRSQNQYEFDGLLTYALKNGNGATIITQPTGTPGVGSPLTTANNDASVDQIETLLRTMWDNYRLSPDVLYVSAQEIGTISKLVIKNGGSPIVRMNGDFSGVNGVTGGSVVGSYLNRYGMNGGQLIKLQLHPNMTPGTILAACDALPYPINNVSNIGEIHYRQDYYQLEWPITKRRYEFGVYADEAFVHYFPGALGVITNIAP